MNAMQILAEVSTLTGVPMIEALTMSKRWPMLEEDLQWFFNQSESDMGMRSTYPAMIRRLRLCGASTSRESYEMSEVMFDAARRARRIKRVLDQLDTRTLITLRCAFHTEPVPELMAFGLLAGVALHSTVSGEEHVRSGTKRPIAEWLARLPLRRKDDPDAQRALVRIHKDAEKRLAAAMSAFLEMRRKVAAHV
jgi:hypothetical protein